jgi:hypothetical protein
MRLWGIVIGCWCALSLGVATAQQVEFPLDYYSFAEIAQRMSIEGRRIECARDLRQRLALIHLKPRSWQETRELLEKALDVRFRKISDAENRWILERDPEVVRVERQRRERLASYLDKEGAQDIRRVQVATWTKAFRLKKCSSPLKSSSLTGRQAKQSVSKWSP